MSRSVCPWNARFAKALPPDSPFAPREVIGDKGAAARARAVGHDAAGVQRRIHGLADEAREAAGLKGYAAVVLGNVGTSEDVDVLTRVRGEEPDSVVREHAAWALGRLTARPERR